MLLKNMVKAEEEEKWIFYRTKTKEKQSEKS